MGEQLEQQAGGSGFHDLLFNGCKPAELIRRYVARPISNTILT